MLLNTSNMERVGPMKIVMPPEDHKQVNLKVDHINVKMKTQLVRQLLDLVWYPQTSP